MSKQIADPVGAAIRDLTHPQSNKRKAALIVLTRLTTDMVDVRDACSHVVWLMLHDPDPEVRLEAAAHASHRASEGHDVGFAVPACYVLLSRPETPEQMRQHLQHLLQDFEKRVPTQMLFRSAPTV